MIISALRRALFAPRGPITCQSKQRNVSYQFRKETTHYYPNRDEEKKRMTDVMQANRIVAAEQLKRRQPTDFNYKVLGLTKHVNKEQIKQAYIGIANKFQNQTKTSPEAKKRFDEITSAFDALSNSVKRIQYDKKCSVMDEKTRLKQFENKWPTFAPYKPLTKMCASNELAKPKEKLNTFKSDMKLDIGLVEAVHGVRKSVSLKYMSECPNCRRNNSKLGSNKHIVPCKTCGGKGTISLTMSTHKCTFTCKDCTGKRTVNSHRCNFCNGHGMVPNQVQVNVHIPSGTKHDDILSVENPNTKEHVSFRINIKENNIFQRKGNDIYSEAYITVTQAILGANIKVKSLYEDMMVTVEPGTQSHAVLRIKDKGIKTREKVGDHLITLKIRIPRQLSMKQRELITALAKAEKFVDNC